MSSSDYMERLVYFQGTFCRVREVGSSFRLFYYYVKLMVSIIVSSSFVYYELSLEGAILGDRFPINASETVFLDSFTDVKGYLNCLNLY